MERINARSKKKRLPNQTQQFIRKDAVPLGKFTKYTWKIVSDQHVRQIFENPDMPLEITRNFILNRDGTYKLFHQRDEDNVYAKGNPNQPLLRPQEYKTKLRVGTSSPGQKEPTPFIIEWIPDILPQSLIGELRIKFEFDHLHNGQLLTPREPRTHGPLLAPRPQQQQIQPTSQPSSQISATEHIISIPITSEGMQSTENMTTILTFWNLGLLVSVFNMYTTPTYQGRHVLTPTQEGAHTDVIMWKVGFACIKKHLQLFSYNFVMSYCG